MIQYKIINAIQQVVYEGDNEKKAVKHLDRLIDGEFGEGYWYLYEKGEDIPMQSGGWDDYQPSELPDPPQFE